MEKHKSVLAFIIVLFLGSCSHKQKDIDYERLNKLMQYGEKEDSVSLELKFMAYACGDCIPQYRIDKVLFSKNENNSYYINKEIDVKFLDEKLKNEIEKLDCDNSCVSYVLSGVFKKNGLGIGRLEANSGKIIKIEKCCK